MQIGKNDILCHGSHYFQLVALPVRPAWQTLLDCPLITEIWKTVFLWQSCATALLSILLLWSVETSKTFQIADTREKFVIGLVRGDITRQTRVGNRSKGTQRKLEITRITHGGLGTKFDPHLDEIVGF